MKKLAGLMLLFLLSELCCEAQTKHMIRFRDKGSSPYQINNPSAYLSSRSIARRTRYNIALDSTDLPVTPRYIDSLRLAGSVVILNVSKWLNLVTIQTTDAAALAKINSFPFVQSVSAIAARTGASSSPTRDFLESFQPLAPSRTSELTANHYNYGSSAQQVSLHKGEFLHNIGLRGQNMILGMMDGGFNNYLTTRAFDSARNNGQILGTWDFVARNASVNEDDAHGSQCLSTIAANIPGQFTGTAPKTSFYLYRTEDNLSEYRIEEINWVCAAEQLDSAGGDVICTSVGYADRMSNPAYDYTLADMNGNTTMIARGADMAARKGILVVSSVGNEGTSGWQRIISPSDGDSVLAVGAVSAARWAAPFTGRGPSSDGQIKPDIASLGVDVTIQYPGNSIGTGSGTSFATPNMAGLATCLWQGFPEFSNMKVIGALRRSGSRSSNPNDSIGYGIPDVRLALMYLVKDFASATASLAGCRTTISWTSKDMSAMSYEIDRMLPGQNSFTRITIRPGTGDLFSNRSYQYEDVLTDVPAGIITYRIRQIIDSSAAGFLSDYLDTVTVNLANACLSTAIDPVAIPTASISLAPNPVSDQLTVKITTAYAVPDLRFRLTDTKGRELGQFRKSKAAGAASFDIPVSGLPKGKYYLSLFDGIRLIATEELIKL
ncbi:MAG TPA: S8 family serine peptidase [Flavisolibacter sp.]|nr:S8 family serine peptidase [Flavisolibacter sp.]